MIIRFEKSGGFTGIHLTTTVDTSELPPEEASRLLQELEKSGLLDTSPEYLETVSDQYENIGAADMVNYEVTLAIGSYEQTYCLTEESVPDSAQPLLRQLTRLARNSSGASTPSS